MTDSILSFVLKIDWAYGPEAFTIGKFTVLWYSLMFLISFLVGLQIMKWVYKKESLDIAELDTLFLFVFLGIILGARFGELFYSWDDYKDAPWEIILPFDTRNDWKFVGFRGLASHGAVVGLLIMLYWFAKKYKKPFWWLVDRIAIPAAFGAGCVRLGNFFNHEIVGKAVDPEKLPWATRFALNETDLADNIYRHPAQLYESLFYFFTFGVIVYVYLKYKEKTPRGLLFGIFMTFIFTFRFLVEYLKDTQNALDASRLQDLGLNTGQLLSIPLVLVGLYFLFVFSRKQGQIPEGI